MRKISLIFGCAVAVISMFAQKNIENNPVFVVGTYTDAGSNGLYSYRFNEMSGNVEVLDSFKIDNPSYLTFSNDGKILYAVSEMDMDNSFVTALAFNVEDGSFKKLNGASVGGSPCYVSTNGNMVVTANYGGGTISVFPLASDGSLHPRSQLLQGGVGGPDTLRQNLPHIHCVEFSPDGKVLYASDFSADRLLKFDVVNPMDMEKNTFGLQISTDSTGSPEEISINADSGPRHLIFDESGRHAYLLGELSGAVTVFDNVDNCLNVLQVIDGDPVYERASGDIHLSPDGRFLYTSNRRRNDGLSIFSVNPDGTLTNIGYQNTGRHPRNFAVTPDGNFILVACRDDNVIEIYRRDKNTGLLTNIHKDMKISKPVCIKFVP